MSDELEIIVDGRVLRVEGNISLLKALRDHGISTIPHLCFYPSLGGRGSCGLCVVEVYEDGIWKSRHACLLYPHEGLQVRTDSPRLRRLRAWAASLLLLRGPFRKRGVDEMLKSLVREGMIAEKPVPLSKDGVVCDVAEMESDKERAGCILCGLCIAICNKVGKGFLTFLGRGKNLRVGFVLDARSRAGCGNCRACRNVCPTGFIESRGQEVFTAKLYG